MIRALRSLLCWTTTRWRIRSAVADEGPRERYKMEAKVWVSRGGQGRGMTGQKMVRYPPRKEDVHAGAADNTSGEETWRHPQRNAEISTPWFSSRWRILRSSNWLSGVTARPWWTGPTAAQSKKTTVDAVRSAQKQLRDWWDRGVDLRRRADDWAIHIFGEHDKEADTWAEKGVRGQQEEWWDDSKLVWSEVSGLCGFSDGRRRYGVCGAGMLIKIFTRTLGLARIYKKCLPVPGKNFLDAQIAHCSMLIESLKKWVDKCVNVQSVPSWCLVSYA